MDETAARVRRLEEESRAAPGGRAGPHGRALAAAAWALLQFILDSDDPYGIVSQLIGAMPSGSYLAISHPTYDFMPPGTVAEHDAANARPGVVFRPRSREELARFFERLEQVPPGIQSVAEWRAEDEVAPRPSAAETAVYGAVARIF